MVFYVNAKQGSGMIFYVNAEREVYIKVNKPEMVNAPERLNKVILRKRKRFDCKTNQVSSKQLASF